MAVKLTWPSVAISTPFFHLHHFKKESPLVSGVTGADCREAPLGFSNLRVVPGRDNIGDVGL